MSKLRSVFTAKDMTTGTPWKRILEFSIPLLIGNIAQQFYNTADSIIVGRYIGDNALAAVGSAWPILNLLLVLFVGVATGQELGITVLWSQGQGKAISHYWSMHNINGNSFPCRYDSRPPFGQTASEFA